MDSLSVSESSTFVTRGRGGEGRVSTSTTSSFTPRGRGRTFGRGSRQGGGRGRGGGPVQVFTPYNAPSTVDARLASDADLASMTNNLRNISSASRVLRPDFGQAGTKISLRANFFAVNYPKKLVLYDYPVIFRPEVKTTETRRRKRLFQLLEQIRDWAPYVDSTAHDGAQRIITRKRFPNEPFAISVPYIGEGETTPRPGAQVYSVELQNPNILRASDLDL